MPGACVRALGSWGNAAGPDIQKRPNDVRAWVALGPGPTPGPGLTPGRSALTLAVGSVAGGTSSDGGQVGPPHCRLTRDDAREKTGGRKKGKTPQFSGEVGSRGEIYTCRAQVWGAMGRPSVPGVRGIF